MVDSDMDADLFGDSETSEGELNSPPEYINTPEF